MDLKLYDTLERKLRAFEPREGQPVTLYVCGPTVYNYAHIGNARPVVVFDVLFRLLRHIYGEDRVIYARNITDVDDKINKKAMDEGVDIGVITDRYAKIYEADMAALGAFPPTHTPRATDHIPHMAAMIEQLLDAEMAYVADGEVLFRVAKYEAAGGRYGALSNRSLDDMISGARVEVAENKENPADFVLWKPSKPGEPEWTGPKGLKGRPGWHIECSAMSQAKLGLPIDIHGGGHDLIFPHHTNEIAQACAAHGHTDPHAYARYWVHNGFLDMGGEKMSKSLGNVVLVHDLLKKWPGEVIRLALLSGHYRSPLDWNEGLLEQSKTTLDGLYQLIRDLGNFTKEYEGGFKNPLLGPQISGFRDELLDGFYSAVIDDLNIPQAISELVALSKRVRALIFTGNIADLGRSVSALNHVSKFLGILQHDPEDWFKGGADEALTEKVEALIAARIEARTHKDWAAADRIRAELTALNIDVMDNPTGATWKLKS